MLDELPKLGASDLADWNMRTETFLVFMACKYPQLTKENYYGSTISKEPSRRNQKVRQR